MLALLGSALLPLEMWLLHGCVDSLAASTYKAAKSLSAILYF